MNSKMRRFVKQKSSAMKFLSSSFFLKLHNEQKSLMEYLKEIYTFCKKVSFLLKDKNLPVLLKPKKNEIMGTTN